MTPGIFVPPSAVHFDFFKSSLFAFLFLSLEWILILPAIALDDQDLARLSQTAQWRTLGHYPRQGDRVESAIDDPSFFLSAEGKNDPYSELAATLNAFRNDEVLPNGERARCRMRARYEWLRDQGFEYFPSDPGCKEFDTWFTEIAPAHATLVFSSSYLNNPASMFGHTFIRIDPPSGRAYAPLVAYAVNFSAQTFGEPGLIYAVKGVFGGYVGRFGVGPYYELVRKYNAYENRDLFEYPLSLSPEEIRRLVLHVWELRGVGIDYYYFDENCSYHLLSLLEVARPELHLLDKFSLWTLPVDTVKVTRDALQHGEWIPIYRPSRSAELFALEARVQSVLGNGAVGEAKLLATDPKKKLPAEPQILDLTFAYLEYLKVQRKVEEGGATASRLREILVARSVLEPIPPVHVPAPEITPDRGHDSSRVRIVSGVRDGHGASWLSWGLAVHDLLDPVGGYVKGAALDLGRATVSIASSGTLRLEELALVDAKSFSPASGLVSPKSWRLFVGAARSASRDGAIPLRGVFEGGIGKTYRLSDSLRGYGLLTAGGESAPESGANTLVGIGPEVGMILQTPHSFSASLTAQAVTLVFDGARLASRVVGRISRPVASHVSVYGEGERKEQFDTVSYRGGGGITIYW